jgi:hypothetical protein
MIDPRILRSAIEKVIARKRGETYTLARTNIAQRRTDSIAVELLTLPEIPTPLTQDWDPESETFGQSLPMADYDPVPD